MVHGFKGGDVLTTEKFAIENTRNI